MEKTSKEAYWRNQLALYASSTLNLKDFCKKQGYSCGSFYHWQKRLKASKVASQHPSFIPIRTLLPVGSTSTLKVCLPNGVSIDYTGAMNETLIKSLAAI